MRGPRSIFVACVTLVGAMPVPASAQGPAKASDSQPAAAPALDDERAPGLEPLRPRIEPEPQATSRAFGPETPEFVDYSKPPQSGRDMKIGGGVALGVGSGLAFVGGFMTIVTQDCAGFVGWCPGLILSPVVLGLGLATAIPGAIMLGVGVKRERYYRGYLRHHGWVAWAPTVGRSRGGTQTYGASFRF